MGENALVLVAKKQRAKVGQLRNIAIQEKCVKKQENIAKLCIKKKVE